MGQLKNREEPIQGKAITASAILSYTIGLSYKSSFKILSSSFQDVVMVQYRILWLTMLANAVNPHLLIAVSSLRYDTVMGDWQDKQPRRPN